MPRKKKRKTEENHSSQGAAYILLAIEMLLSLGLTIGGIRMAKTDLDQRSYCTALTEGDVVRVEKRPSGISRRKRSSSLRTYIEVKDENLSVREIVLEQGGFRKGESVTIHYDPENGYNYYVEGAAADKLTGGIGLTVIGAAMLLFSAAIVIHIIRKKKAA
ncbi:DUF3592 domain-containing protein [Ruminococcus sp.]|uniref:DUF3592 domain-containing protein n=1 Tax=Ruminococcus sp. TaxID=41978 RepID=UPI0025EBCA84|nr:DUF3592 domain-containing protein [Ruminococcus sp.]MBQ8967037.1 hypothetical protein [Ruminococcus sp.]